jgi:tungstate transport system permease protein
MVDIANAAREALRLILVRDAALYEIIFLSLEVTGIGLLLSTIVGIPLGSWMGLTEFTGRRFVMALLYTGMGFPPVVVGLFVYLLFSRSGPLGELSWLFTPPAMVVAQTIISFPLVAGFTMAAVMGVDPNLRQQVLSLGATHWQATLAILSEARIGVLVSVIAGFGRIISEGNFDLAISLGIVLLTLTFLANLLMLRLQGGQIRVA